MPRREFRRALPVCLLMVAASTWLASAACADEELPPGLFEETAEPAIDLLWFQEPSAASPATESSFVGQDPGGGLGLPLVESFQKTVTSLTLLPNTVGKTPAAIFVIDQEMIRRSGAQTVPEVLRMVPGVHVANQNTVTPNVSVRGFGTGNVFFPLSARVLVLIDGRSIYDPGLGGINWMLNDLVLQDIERIEVIRGPGATVWGANAVNGVINIITKSADKTQGLLVQGLGGTEYKTIATVRYGAEVGENSHLRVFGKFRDFDDGWPTTGQPAVDGFHDFRTGFRWDAETESGDQFSAQGNLFDEPRSGSITLPSDPDVLSPNLPAEYRGGYAQGRWTRTFYDDSQLTLMAIYDRCSIIYSGIDYTRNSYILDAAYNWAWGERHKWLVGAQFRLDEDSTDPQTYRVYTVEYVPPSRSYNVASWLLQDEIQLVPGSLSFIAGTKMEVNSFTGFEIQPSGRLLKTIDERRVVWAAISRAIRRPNRIDDAATGILYLPIGPEPVLGQLVPNAQLKADALAAYEAGYRAQPADWLSWDLAAFYNVYNHLPAATFLTNTVPVTVTQVNGIGAQSYGAELSGTVEFTDR